MPAIGLTIADWVIILIYFAFVLGIGIFGRPRSVLKLDCRSLEHAYYPFDRDDLRIVLCDTRVKRELASSEYNVRRSQCEEGVKVLGKYNPGLRSLRDMTAACRRARPCWRPEAGGKKGETY